MSFFFSLFSYVVVSGGVSQMPVALCIATVFAPSDASRTRGICDHCDMSPLGIEIKPSYQGDTIQNGLLSFLIELVFTFLLRFRPTGFLPSFACPAAT